MTAAPLANLPQTFAPPQAYPRARALLAGILGLAITAGAVGLVAAALAPMPSDAKAISLMGGAVALVSALVITWLMLRAGKDLAYVVEPGQLRVRTPWGQTAIPLAGVTVRTQTAQLSLRLMGMGAPGLYIGWYLAGGQRVRVWSTLRNGGLLLAGKDNERWIVTPADPEAMCAALEAGGARIQAAGARAVVP